MQDFEYLPRLGSLTGQSFEKQTIIFLQSLIDKIKELDIVCQRAYNKSESAINSIHLLSGEVEVKNGVINVMSGEFFRINITKNTAISLAGVHLTASDRFYLRVINGGAYTVTWPTNFKWINGIKPTLSVTGTDYFEFITPDGGSSWFCLLWNKY